FQARMASFTLSFPVCGRYALRPPLFDHHPCIGRQAAGISTGASPSTCLSFPIAARTEVKNMARVCQVTGKAPMTGNNVSHANNKTKRRFLPNLQTRRFWVESENRWVRLRVSAKAIRIIDKVGIDAVLADLRARGEVA